MKNLPKISAALAAALLIGAIGSAAGQELSGQAGAFADIGLGLRPVGMGGAYSALASDENSARWNPALLAETRDPVAGFAWTRQFNLISYSYVSLAYPVGMSGFGLGGYFLSSGDDIYSETIIGAGAGVSGSKIGLPKLIRLGATLKIYLSSYGDAASGGGERVQGDAFGYGLDLAAAFRLSEKVQFAAVGRDLVNNVSWDRNIAGRDPKSYDEGVPSKLALAGAYQEETFALSFDFQPSLYGDVPDRLGVGAEFVLFGAIKPRLGLAQNFGSTDLNRWLTLGMGIDLKPRFLGPIHSVGFGYTHLFHDIDDTPRVGLALSW